MRTERKRRTRGTGHVAEKKNKDRTTTYYAVYRLGAGYKWEKGGTTRREAERLLGKRLVEIESGQGGRLQAVTFAHYAARWLQDKGNRKIKPSTLQDYESIVAGHLLPAFNDGSLNIQNLTVDVVRDYITAKQAGGILPVGERISKDRPVAPKTIRNQLAVLYGICKLAVADGKLGVNPVSLAEKPEADECDPLFLDRSELERLIDAMPEEWRVFTSTMSYAGLRLGEARGLRIGDLDADALKLHVRKTITRNRQEADTKTKAGKRDLPLSKRFVKLVEDHCDTLTPEQKKTGLLFPDPQGKAIDPDHYREQIFKPAAQKAGLVKTNPDFAKLRVHDLRHSFASLMIREKPKMHPKALQVLMGHAQFETTMKIYAHVSPEYLAEIGTAY